ncbi:YkvA family protein [Devosia rhodophyticola]|uniref:YkvA family protein n=1 Tax=Devosia rhodophyticola TaxID=3026423 RepID=A0ABY7YXQ4_9HYPH|nr:YkvA family protein [Devosia rhodophyticola]WDR06101.1 YkvA family protein [Devosia rhodophyticola]
MEKAEPRPESDTVLLRAKRWAKAIKRDVIAIWLAARDPRTPWTARILAATIAAYALSPIDLIPDFIPVLGYLDDLLIVPLGILAVIKLVPGALMAEFRQTAAHRAERPTSRWAAIVVVLLWCLAILASLAVLTDFL